MEFNLTATCGPRNATRRHQIRQVSGSGTDLREMENRKCGNSPPEGFDVVSSRERISFLPGKRAREEARSLILTRTRHCRLPESKIRVTAARTSEHFLVSNRSKQITAILSTLDPRLCRYLTRDGFTCAFPTFAQFLS